MNTDFRLSVGFFENPKIVRLERKHGDSGVVSWIRLLRFTAVHRPDGRLTGMDSTDIAIAARWLGDEEVFITALKAPRDRKGTFGLLDEDADGTLSIHGWEEHNPFAAHSEDRSERARNAANARWGNRGGQPDATEKTTEIEKKPGPLQNGPLKPDKGRQKEQKKPPTDTASMPNAENSMPEHATRIAQSCPSMLPAMRVACSGNAPTPTPIPNPNPNPNPTHTPPLTPPPNPYIPRLEGEGVRVFEELRQYFQEEDPEILARQVYVRGADAAEAQMEAVQWRINQGREIGHPFDYWLAALDRTLPIPAAVIEQREARRLEAQEAKTFAQQQSKRLEAERAEAERAEAEQRFKDLPPEQQLLIEQETGRQFCTKFEAHAGAWRKGKLSTGQAQLARRMRDEVVMAHQRSGP